MKNPESRQASSGFQQMSFLPELKFNPKHPNPNTQPAKVLARLLNGERLTQPSYGLSCWRLAAYIKELDYLGWPIESADVPCPQGLGTGRPIKEYWLPIKSIEQSNQTPLSSAHAAYEALKQRWDSIHKDATPRQRDAALMCLAKECGV
jgi:hypothetical protein